MKRSLESWVPGPYQPELVQKPHYIALVIIDPRINAVLLGLEADHEKKWNIQTETLELYDHDVQAATIRGLAEELRAPIEWFKQLPEYNRQLTEWKSELGIRSTFHCACLFYIGEMGHANRIFHPKDPNEIIDVVWFPLDALPATLEMEARFLIEEYRKMLKT